MRVVIEVEKPSVGSMEGPRWHERRTVELGREQVPPELREELERHRCGEWADAEYQLPAYDGLTRVYSVTSDDVDDVLTAVSAWRRHRERMEAVQIGRLQGRLFRELINLRRGVPGHG